MNSLLCMDTIIVLYNLGCRDKGHMIVYITSLSLCPTPKTVSRPKILLVRVMDNEHNVLFGNKNTGTNEFPLIN